MSIFAMFLIEFALLLLVILPTLLVYALTKEK